MNWKKKLYNREINKYNVKIGDIILLDNDPGDCAHIVGQQVKVTSISTDGIRFEGGGHSSFGFFKRFKRIL